MRFDIRSLRARLAFAAAVLLPGVGYLGLATRHFLGWRAAEQIEEPSLQRAVRLLPGNAEIHNRLGRYLFHAKFDVEGAIEQFRIATALNPYSARYWLDLADAYLVGDDIAAQEQAVERALAAEPTNPDVALRAANHYLVSGDVQRALPSFRVVIANHNPQVSRSAVEVCWRATKDAELLLNSALPPKAEAYSDLLNHLIDQNETAAAGKVWERLLALRQEVPLRTAFRYLDYLVAHRQVEPVQSAWADLTLATPGLKEYRPGEGLVVNGGFELSALNGGLDWRYAAPVGVNLSVDSTQFHRGTQSLLVEYHDFQGSDAGLLQLVPVRPNTRYEFSVYLKGDSVLTTSGPRLALTDHYTGEVQGMTDDLLGSTAWRQDRMEFTTGPETWLLRLRVLRSSTARPVRGRMWVDDILLREKQP
jgi:tetratricopeptide (TPR) repeat protein